MSDFEPVDLSEDDFAALIAEEDERFARDDAEALANWYSREWGET